jgi:hypothetical protein
VLASPDFQHLVDDMVETMHEYDGVGLAGPQVHVGLRVAVLEVPASDERAREAVPLTVLVNPVVTPLGEEKEQAWEGCLSIPDLRGVVPRWKRLRLEALDRRAALHPGGGGVPGPRHPARVRPPRRRRVPGPDGGLRSLSFLREFERFVASREDE